MKKWDVIYEYCQDHENCSEHGFYRVEPPHPAAREQRGNPLTPLQKLNATYTFDLRTFLGIMFLALGLGGLVGPFIPQIRMETQYAMSRVPEVLGTYTDSLTNNLPRRQEGNQQLTNKPLPKAVPVVFEPLKSPDGTIIEPVSTDFGVVIPKIGVNATVIPGVDPSSKAGYVDALQAGVAHANTSFFPDQDGTVYLFSHSTNYDWFVKDLNAVFYLVKNLETDDVIVILYKNKRYTYKITSKKVVSPKSISYLIPYAGKKNLILQTCWPPGSTTERLLIFADLIEENGKQI